MGEPLDTPVPVEEARLPRFPGFVSFQDYRFVASLFFSLIAIQALGFLLLGTERAGRSVSLVSLVAQNGLAIVCAWTAFRRARNVAALFWFLFTISLLILQFPQTFGTYDTLFAKSTLSIGSLSRPVSGRNRRLPHFHKSLSPPCTADDADGCTSAQRQH